MVWNRAELKSNAKKVLSGTYITALIVGLVLTIASDTSWLSRIEARFNSGYSLTYLTSQLYYINPAALIPLIIQSLLSLLFFVGLGTIFRVLVGFHLEVGAQRYYIDTAQMQESGFARLKYGFDNYGNILKTMVMRGITIFLWTLLLIVPGIIKSFAYIMVPYILADNPNMDYKRAMQLSNDMTMGHKMDIFVLELSFLGWYILGAVLPYGVGLYFVYPYRNATMAQLYLKLRDNAVNTGMAAPAELCLTAVSY